METALTGAAGVYYVAARLAAMGLKCAPTFGNVPSVDIVVSNGDGSASVALQVKTAKDALRMKGRGHERKPDRYEWDIGRKCARLSAPKLFFALVDLKGFSELPDVYIVPSAVIASYFNGDGWKRWRFHPLIEAIDPFRNKWSDLQDRLDELGQQAGGLEFPGHTEIKENASETQLLEESRRGRESIKNIFLTEDDIRAAKHWGRE